MALDFNRFSGSLLSALGSGLMSAGGEGGWSNFAPGFMQGQQYFDQQAQQRLSQEETRKLRELQQQQLQMQIEQQRDENKRRVKAEQDFRNALQPGYMAPNGMSQAQFGGAPMQPGLMSGFDPRQAALLNALPYEQAAPILAQELFKEPAGPDWKIEKVREGDKDVTYRIDLNTGQREKIGEGAAFAPQQPQQGPADVQEYLFAKQQGFNGTFMDYQASQKGQGISMTMPDGTVVQVGGAIKPPTESQMQAVNRATLFKTGMDKLSELYTNPDIGAWNMAGAETAEMFGPLGRVAGAKMRSAAEQQWQAAHSSALEGLAAAVTGAGVTKDQFARYTSMLPAPTDEDPKVREYKLNLANDFLAVALQNSGAAGQALLDTMKGDPKKAPIVGTVEEFNGVKAKFKGGDPKDRNNWEVIP